jgi:hypothetical protein
MKVPRLKHESLLAEKSLWEIYRASWSISDSRFNWLVGLASLLFFTAYALFEPNWKPIHGMLLKLAELGFNTAVSILGFLIAGFTIFGSLTKPKLLFTMLRFTHKKSGLSYLKYNFFTLLRTFIYFLIFGAFQLAVIVFGQRDGPLSLVLNWWPESKPVFGIVLRCALVASAVLWTAVFLELKSFVFNVHHFVFTMIKFDAVEHNASFYDHEDEQSGKPDLE